MGTYLNPGNNGFAEIVNTDYVDKTGMIELINNRINTLNKLICISRPRRFGKSYAAKMLCAYYDCSCNSENLFDNLEIAKSATYHKHMNKYNVIYLDISGIVSLMIRKDIDLKNIARFISSLIRDELVENYPSFAKFDDVSKCILECVNETKKSLYLSLTNGMRS